MLVYAGDPKRWAVKTTGGGFSDRKRTPRNWPNISKHG